MTREEFIGKLQMVYVGDKHASADIIREYDRLNNILDELENIFIECDYQHLQRKLKALKENNNA